MVVLVDMGRYLLPGEGRGKRSCDTPWRSPKIGKSVDDFLVLCVNTFFIHGILKLRSISQSNEVTNRVPGAGRCHGPLQQLLPLLPSYALHPFPALPYLFLTTYKHQIVTV